MTGVDLAVQDFLKERLCRLSSNIGFLSEEQDSFEWEFQSPVWVLDPVDGTTNLIHDFSPQRGFPCADREQKT